MNNIKSMTGYGKATSTNELRHISVEIKSLNSKQLDLSTKIASLYREFESEIRTVASKRLIRGKVEIFVTYENINTVTTTSINKELFNHYYQQISELECDKSNTDIVSLVLRMPEVMASPKISITPDEKELLFATLNEALYQYDKFRNSEGEAMMQDILQRVTNIETLLKEVDQYEKSRLESIKSRILENIERNGISVDMNRFEQEMIFYVEKLDITEEKVRLQRHIDYFRTECNNANGVGKKLGFVTQEIGREINTLGSKSNNFNMQQIVVCMKDELEKMKEQLLNIL